MQLDRCLKFDCTTQLFTAYCKCSRSLHLSAWTDDSPTPISPPSHTPLGSWPSMGLLGAVGKHSLRVGIQLKGHLRWGIDLCSLEPGVWSDIETDLNLICMHENGNLSTQEKIFRESERGRMGVGGCCWWRRKRDWHGLKWNRVKEKVEWCTECEGRNVNKAV